MGDLVEIPPTVEPGRVGAVTDRTGGSRETWGRRWSWPRP